MNINQDSNQNSKNRLVMFNAEYIGRKFCIPSNIFRELCYIQFFGGRVPELLSNSFI